MGSDYFRDVRMGHPADAICAAFVPRNVQAGIFVYRAYCSFSKLRVINMNGGTAPLSARFF
jgi:hypothetical protein